MKFLNRLWYRWRLKRYLLDNKYCAPLWSDTKDGWIYPDGTFVKRTEQT